MTVRIRFVGSGNAFADGGRSNACLQVLAPGVSLLLDFGGSSLPALKRCGVDPGTIEAIAVTHLHGDHFGGIPYFVLEQHFAGRRRPLTIGGPPSLAERLRTTEQGLFPDFFGTVELGFSVRVVVLGTEPQELGGARVSALPVRHVRLAEPHGLRVEAGGRLIAYSGDARWSEELATLARGADLFVSECSHFATADPSHLSYRELVAHRSELDCRRIVLTHLGDEALAHRGELALEHAEDGTVVEVA